MLLEFLQCRLMNSRTGNPLYSAPIREYRLLYLLHDLFLFFLSCMPVNTLADRSILLTVNPGSLFFNRVTTWMALLRMLLTSRIKSLSKNHLSANRYLAKKPFLTARRSISMVVCSFSMYTFRIFSGHSLSGLSSC